MALKLSFIFPALLVLVWSLPGSSQTRRSLPSPQAQYQISFRDQLKISDDLKLVTNVSSESVLFHCESAWKPVHGSALHLFVRHSADLDGDRSFLSASLNYGILRSLRLHQHNEELTEVVIPLPPEMLKHKNQLRLSVEQFSAKNNPSAELWTAVSNQSFIVIQYEGKRPQLDLELLPSPLLDHYSYRPKKLSLLLPEKVSSATLEAIALLLANLCNRVSPEAVDVSFVRSIQAARGPVLIVGTPQEQPELRILQGRSSVALYKRGAKTQVGLTTGEGLEESDGVAVLTTRTDDDHNPILFVTGSSPSGVLRAARNLVGPNIGVSGSIARFSQDPRRVSRTLRDWKGFIPPKNRFTLADLGFKELEFNRRNDYSILIPLNATPDAQFLNYGHGMVLVFELEVNHIFPDSHLDVSLNDTLLQSYGAQEISGTTRISLKIKVPALLLKPRNVLKIVLHGSWQDKGQESIGSLLPSSEFSLPRDYRAVLPDLGLLQFNLYPFSLRPDFSDTIVVLPNTSTEGVLASLAEVSCVLGRLSPTDQLAFRVRQLEDLTQEEKDKAHLIYLDLQDSKGMRRQTFLNWKPLPWIDSVKGVPTVQESASPWNSEKYVLRISANSSGALRQAIALCFSETILKQLKGDAAYLRSNQPVCFTLGPKREIQEHSYLAHVEVWLRVNWIALPIILTAASGLLFVGLRLTLSHYKSKRMLTG